MKIIISFLFFVIHFTLRSQTYTDSMYTIYNTLFSDCYVDGNRLFADMDKIDLRDSVYCYTIFNNDLKAVTAISDIIKLKKKESIYSYSAFFFVKNDKVQLYIDEGGNVLLTTTILNCIKNAGPGSLFILAEIHFDGDGISENNAPIVIKVI